MTDYRKNGGALGGSGMANPMTTVGDIIVGDTVSGGVAAPARLGAGSSGYVMRSVAGTPAWRELSAAGLAGDRPNAIATREGQTYWSTDGAAGSELAMVVHKGGTTYDWEILPYGGPGLPVAGGAGEVPLSTGAGTAYVAANFGDEVTTAIAGGIGATLGQTVIGDGAGGIIPTSADVSALLASATAAAMRGVLYPQTPISLASSSGWTTSASAGCTAAINTGAAQADLSLPAAAGAFTNAYAVRTPPVLGAWEFRARLRTHSGGTDVGDVAQLIVYGPGNTLYAGVNVRGDDTIVLVSDTTGPAASAAASIRGGQGWVRVVCDGGTIRVLWGIGAAGVAPTAWNSLGSAVRVNASAPYSSELRLSGNRGATVSGTLAVSWGDLSYRDYDL